MSRKYVLKHVQSEYTKGMSRPMSENRESGIRQIFAVGIRNPEARVRNPQWFGIRNPGPSWILLHGVSMNILEP